MSTIAVGLSLAFVLGLLAARLHISPIVGYLAAGVMIGPHSPGFVGDMKVAEELSEIGIVLLMFGVGLHFSLKDLMAVRRISLPGALVQMTVATSLGLWLARVWGWSLDSGLLFGLALSVASTVVMLRALEEHNLLHTTNGHIAVGWLIVEDLAMVLALILIPALAGGEGGGPAHGSLVTDIFLSLGKVAAFVVLMCVAGCKVLPWLLSAVIRTGSRELFTLAVFAMAMGIAFGAAKMFGVSFALGAFFAGMMIRESDLSHEVANRALPFQEAFAVLFFVAVGMLFNPAIIPEEPLKVLAVVSVIVIGKSLAASALVLLFGYPLKTALLVSVGLAQIGEFSFVLVGMGLEYGLLSEEGKNLILAGALISISLNPLTFIASERIFGFIQHKPRLAGIFNLRDTDLSRLRDDEKRRLKKTVILVGGGVLGGPLARSLRRQCDLVVIDINRETVETLRREKIHALAGDAGQAEVLKEATLGKAVTLIVTIRDAYASVRIVRTARKLNPDVKIIARAYNEEEMHHFKNEPVDLLLNGPQEIRRRIEEYLHDTKNYD